MRALVRRRSAALLAAALWVALGACAADLSSPDAGPGPEPDGGLDASSDAGPDAGRADAGSPDAARFVPPTCGNGTLDSLEACDGALFQPGISSCEDYNLGPGESRCTSLCTLDLSRCASQDYCEGASFYYDEQCDACEWMGGRRDPACDDHCGEDGLCASWFDSAVGEWSCEALGLGPDPDCGTCGNGIVEGEEYCDGSAFRVLPGNILTDSCQRWSYPNGGTLRCLLNCTPDFTGCLR